MSVDRKTWGWCPSVLRPMPLSDGLMVRIRVPGGALDGAQAKELADLAGRFGAGFIELTNRANLQLRGLSEAQHAALVPELEALGLAKIDHTPSGRVNITRSPFLDPGESALANALAEGLAQAEFSALPQKFGFVVDSGIRRVLTDVPGDVRIERATGAFLVRADGSDTGRETTDPVATALEMARWFLTSGGGGADGCGRMRKHVDELPSLFRGKTRPNRSETVSVIGPQWLVGEGGKLSPNSLCAGLLTGVSEIRITPFRALYLPELAAAESQWNRPNTTGQGTD